jgi:hypothetical protein
VSERLRTIVADLAPRPGERLLELDHPRGKGMVGS